MTALLESKVVITEATPTIRNTPAVPTSVVGAVGVTERGPIATPVLCTSFEEYRRTFGGLTANSMLALALRGLFDNAGQVSVWVTRTVHYTTITNPATKTSAAATLNLVDRAGSPLATLKVDGKYDGAYGNLIRIKISNPTSGAANEFNLDVLDEATGVVLESFPNLLIGTANAASAQYVETVINDPDTGSQLIVVDDLASVTVAPNNLPALGTFDPTGGNDGLSGLAAADFTGDAGAQTGVHALDTVQDLSILIIPDGAPSTAIANPVHNKMVSYCEVTREKSMIAILDPPPALTASAMLTYVVTTAGLLNLSEHGAIFWPRVKVVNPSEAIFGVTTDGNITVPPSGIIAGVFARQDAARAGGIYEAAAGIENGVLFGVVDFETQETLDAAKRGLIYPKRINPLTTGPGFPRFIDGARTLKGNGNFPYINERRGVIFIEQSVKQLLEAFRFKNNTEETRNSAERSIDAFLRDQMHNGAFRSQDPEKAYFVDFSEALNPPSVVFSGQMKGRVGLATNKPAEFIFVEFTQDTRALDEELAAS